MDVARFFLAGQLWSHTHWYTMNDRVSPNYHGIIVLYMANLMTWLWLHLIANRFILNMATFVVSLATHVWCTTMFLYDCWVSLIIYVCRTWSYHVLDVSPFSSISFRGKPELFSQCVVHLLEGHDSEYPQHTSPMPNLLVEWTRHFVAWNFHIPIC